ncbi:hypothetical protein MBUL_03182 [Methylobacterium bullatum]|uniref:Uncharacterized protein n=1 Tax=Methylobacterium bullatum TaxID=570505 RepID=A0A679JC99_9HYPH|nr:hypothetical protein MBUL_03182 [Methylobacterium bullatum]
MITVDLNTKIVLPHNRVWRMFPGYGYKFLSSYFSQNSAFLDIPGFDMPEGSLEEDDEFLKRIAASENIIHQKRSLGADVDVDMDWTQLKPAYNTQGRGILKRSMINFYEEARLGDIIVVPSPVDLGEIYVGTLTDRRYSGRISNFPREYGEVPMPARRVSWLQTIKENKVSPALSSSLRHQNPFNLLEKSLYNEVFAIAYSSYVYGEERGSIIYNTLSDYIDKDAAFLGLISQVSAAICHMVDEGSNERKLSLINTILDQQPMEYYCSQSVDIHSPGLNRFLSSKNTPIMIISLIGLLAFLGNNSSEKNLKRDIQNVTVTNTISGPEDGCSVPVDKGTKMFLDTTPIDEIWRLCKLAREARERAGVQSGVTVTAPNKPSLEPPKKVRPR